MKVAFFRLLNLSICVAVSSAAAFAQNAAPPLAYDTFTLENGLRFVVHEDHSTPIVAVDVWYDVGSANEPAGRSGFAHLFEHLLFQETENLDKGEADALLESAGAAVNGTTNQDRTLYFEVVPSNRVNLALWIEAERMARLRVREENFLREREVVKEERRMRYDNAPYMNGLLMLDTLYTDYRPYRHTVIGSMSDLDAATVEDVAAFYKQYYVPNNATVVLAGDITVAQAKQYAQEYFAAIPRGPDLPALPPAVPAPRTDGERRQTLEDKLASVPLLLIGYNVPEHRAQDIPALTLLSSILGSGESSRLNQALVKDAKVALFAAAYLRSHNMGGYFGLQAQPTQGNDIAEVEQMLYAQIDKIKGEGIEPQELDKVKRQFIAGQIMQRQSVLNPNTISGKAEDLQHARFMHGDLESVNTDLNSIDAVTVDDIRRVAQKYLDAANRTVVTVVPAQKATTSD